MLDMALGLAHHARLRRDVETRLAAGPDHQLRRTATDVDDQSRRLVFRIALAGRPEERQLGLLIALEDVRLKPVAVSHRLREFRSVARVPDGAGEDRDLLLWTAPLDLFLELVERRVHAFHRVVL